MCLALLYCKNEYAGKLLEKNQFGMPALIRQGKTEELWLGSSAFRQGIDMEIIAGKWEDAWLISYNGNQPVFEQAEVEYLLQNGVLIDRLYVDMYAYAAAREPWVSDDKLFLETDLAFKNKIWEMIRDDGQAGVSDWFQMYVSANNEQLLVWPLNNRLVDARFYRGGNRTETAGASKETLDGIRLDETPPQMNEKQKEALRGMIRLARENGIEIAFVETPKYRTVMENEIYQSLMREFVELTQEEKVKSYLTEETAGLLADDGQDLYKTISFDVSEPSYFADTVHMSARGRRVFTELLTAARQDAAKSGEKKG